MNDPWFLCWHIPLSLLNGGFLAASARRLLPERGGWRRALVIFLWGIFTTTPSWVGDENLLILLPCFLLATFLGYGGSRLARLTVGLDLYLLMLSVNIAFDSARQEFLWSGAVSGVVLRNAVWALLWAAVRAVTEEELPRLPRQQWGHVLVLTLAPLISLLAFSIWDVTCYSDARMDALLTLVTYTLLPFTLLTSLVLIFTIVQLSHSQRLAEQNRLAQLRQSYYDGLRQQQTALRTLRHDLRNHLGALQGLLEAGEVPRALAYCQTLTDSPALQGRRRFCANETANVVLCAKAARAEELGLAADFSARIPAALPVADADLCALLGNALDNAMEAAAAAAPGGTVTLRASAQKGLLMLRVENPAAVPAPEGGTAKPDKASHGLGLPSMREIAARYHGTLNTSYAAGRFELIVCLQLPT